MYNTFNACICKINTNTPKTEYISEIVAKLISYKFRQNPGRFLRELLVMRGIDGSKNI